MSPPALAPMSRQAAPMSSRVAMPGSAAGALNAAEPWVLCGYAALFHQLDGTGDIIRPGAFRATLSRRGGAALPLLWQHDPARPIGRWLRLVEDAHGLQVQGTLTPGVQAADEAARLVQSGALTGLSIGFRTVRAERAAQRGSGPRRVLTEIDLWEVSLVTFPQMAAARVRLLPPVTSMPQPTLQSSRRTR